MRLNKLWHGPMTKRLIKPPYSTWRATSIGSDCCRLPTTSVLSIKADKLRSNQVRILVLVAGRPGGSAGNLETFWRWDVSSNLGVVTRTGIFTHKMPNKWRTIKSLVHKIRLHGWRGKGTGESFSWEKLRHVPQKEGGWEILCDPGWYVHKPDVQNKWEENTHTHTHTHCSAYDTIHALSMPTSYQYWGWEKIGAHWLVRGDKCKDITRCWNRLEDYWPCAGGLSAVNAIGTQLGDPVNSGLTGWRMTA